METSNFEHFTVKILEMESIYQSLTSMEKEKAFKVILSLCKQWEKTLGLHQTCIKSSGPESVIDPCRPLTPEKIVQSILDDFVTKAVSLSEEKNLTWSSHRLRERKPVVSRKQNIYSTVGDFGSGNDDTDDDYDSDFGSDTQPGLGSRSKRKQIFPRRTFNQEQTTQKRRGRKPSAHRIKNNVPVRTSSPSSKLPVADQTVKVRLVAKETLDAGTSKRKRGRPPKRRIYACSKCNETFTHNMSFLAHVVIHGDMPRSCRYCRKEFINDSLMEAHRCYRKRSVFAPEGADKPKICRICGDEFHNTNLLHEHLKREHDMSTKLPQFFCKFCSKGFTKRSSLYTHYHTHAEGRFVCKKCGEFSNSFEAYSLHMGVHDKDAKYCCENCGANFVRAQQYEQHLQAHERHDCPKCHKRLASRKALIRHSKLEHGDKLHIEERTHCCDECDKKFARPGMLIVHKRIHTGEKPIECDVCKVFFRTTKALAKHKQTYTHSMRAGEAAKERRFLCSECGKAYFRKHALQRHMRYHTGEKPHMCQYCGYKCREANNLKRHMALHFESERNYICEMCGAAFHAKKTLEMHHAYKHSEDREYQCSECALCFKAKNALKRHMKVHSVDKEHKCWCGTAFKRMYNLRRHLKSVHGNDQLLPPVRRVSTLDRISKSSLLKPDAIQSDIDLEVAAAAREILSREMSDSGIGTPGPTTVPGPPQLMNPPLTTSDTRNSTPVTSPIPVSTPIAVSTPVPIATQNLHHGLRYEAAMSDPQLHHHQSQPPHLTEEMLQRMRLTSDPSVYANNGMERQPIDPNDPYLQISAPVSGNVSNLIPQAVAYSTIMREYGNQFPFLQDGSMYSSFVNSVK